MLVFFRSRLNVQHDKFRKLTFLKNIDGNITCTNYADTTEDNLSMIELVFANSKSQEAALMFALSHVNSTVFKFTIFERVFCLPEKYA